MVRRRPDSWFSWWRARRSTYRRAVGVGQFEPIHPLPRPAELGAHSGRWVAVLDGEVIASEATSHQLAVRLHSMDHRKRRRAVVEYVRPTADSYIVGAG